MTTSKKDKDLSSEELFQMMQEAGKGFLNKPKDNVASIQAERIRIQNKPDQQEAFVNHYIRYDSWLLFSEAILICIGYKPEHINFARVDKSYKAIEKLAKASANITLKILNKDKPEGEWRVSPKDFISWAQTKGIEILPYLNRSLDEPNKPKMRKEHGNAELNAQKREAILHAALGVLVAFPEECKTHGKISASAIAKTIEQNSIIWFGYDELPLGNRKMVEIISRAIQSAKK